MHTQMQTGKHTRVQKHAVCIVSVMKLLCVSEGEQEEQWLQDAGLSTLIRQQQQRPDRDRDREQDREDQDVDQAILLSTLTRTQAAAVQRRLDSYTLSLRKRSKPPPRDVRDVFSSSPSSIAQVRLTTYFHTDMVHTAWRLCDYVTKTFWGGSGSVQSRCNQTAAFLFPVITCFCFLW